MPHPCEARAHAIIRDCGGDLHELAACSKIGGVGRAGIIELEDQRGLAEADPEIALWIKSSRVGEELRSRETASGLACGKCAGGRAATQVEERGPIQ